MTTAELTTKAMTIASKRTSDGLIADYLALEAVRTPEAPIVRGWIMDTLEARGDLGLLALALDLCPGCWAHTCDCEG